MNTTDKITTFGLVEQSALEQMEDCMTIPSAMRGVLCCDNHFGYSMPVGGTIAFDNEVFPHGVGYDISCVCEGSLVLLEDGRRVSIEKFVRQPYREQHVFGFDEGEIKNAGSPISVKSKMVKTLTVLNLINGDQIRTTGDHEILTGSGWKRADEIDETDAVAVSGFVGMEEDGTQNSYDYRLLRLFGHQLGDGHLPKSKKHSNRLCFYSSVDKEADLIAQDLVYLGYTPRIHRRTRPSGSRENNVYLDNKGLRKWFETQGAPVGRKVFSKTKLEWLSGLTKYEKAQFLSGFFSAEMTKPSLSKSGTYMIAPSTKAGGLNPIEILSIVQSLAKDLGFHSSIQKGDTKRKTYVLQFLGGERKCVHLYRMIGFCYSPRKIECLSVVLSVVWQKFDYILERERSRDLCVQLRQSGVGVHHLHEEMKSRFGIKVAHRFAIRSIYEKTGKPRAWKKKFPVHTYGEIVFCQVKSSKKIIESANVYDISLGQEIHNFIANGIIVHNCGNMCVRTKLDYEDIKKDITKIMDTMVKVIPFGVGRFVKAPIEHPLFDDPTWDDVPVLKTLFERAYGQLGTVGSGNHFVDIFHEKATGKVWVGNHFGSRGFGHGVASGFMKLAAGGEFDDRKMPKFEGHLMLNLDTPTGQDYWAAMELAGRYAYAGRDRVIRQVLAILGTETDFEVHNHHNFAWKETHFGKEYVVVRKGATPARPGQFGFIGSNMCGMAWEEPYTNVGNIVPDPSVIVRGVESHESEEALYTTVHGAGRVMSRTAALGYSPRDRKRKPKGAARVTKKMMEDILKKSGIHLRGGDRDEAPFAYKKLAEVLDLHKGTIEVLHELTPVGVVMAGPNIIDPFSD